MGSFWSLPNPRRFVERIAQDLREGRSVVLWLPQFAPDGITEAIREATTAHRRWTPLFIDGVVGRPADVLFSRLEINLPAEQLRSARSLAKSTACSGHVLCLDGVPIDRWPAWDELCTEYADEQRALDPMDRSPLLLVLAGPIASSLPAKDVLKSVHRFAGIVEPLDLQVHASELLRRRTMSPAERRLSTGLLAELSAFDPALLEALASEALSTILTPTPALARFAAERGLDASSVTARTPDRETWALGLSDDVHGRPAWHSALLPQLAPGELQRRLWTAQVSVVFPMIETQRRQILEQLGPVLQVPHTTDRGEVIDRLGALELGHIEAQLHQAGARYRDVRFLVRTLRELRNRLAHLEALTPDLLSEDVLDLLGR